MPLKDNVDKAADIAGCVKKILVVKATGATVAMQDGRDIWVHDVDIPDDCAPEPMAAEDPLFILYTSGSTGKPKGVVHSSGGYLLWSAMTHKMCFDHQPGEIFWCAADV